MAALLLMAAFLVAAPYLSSALKQGYSILSEQAATGPGVIATSQVSTAAASAQCSSVVSVKSIAPPDIKNGSADIAYPPDYCTLASYALQRINADRAANGTGPVSLGYNQAAQQHADSMLYYGYFSHFSHFDTQGYKPYMRYSLLGGRGADFENVAFISYSANHFASTSAAEEAIRQLESSMVYNDSSCCSNGHRYNILNPLHNIVSIGVAYSGTTLYFDEEFESDYVNLNFTATAASAANPYYVTMTGTLIQSVAAPGSIYIGFDSTPAPETTGQLDSGPHEYTPGTLIGGVLPPAFLGRCAQFTTGITVCADNWKFSPSGVDIAFSLRQFVKTYGPGVYTVYLITGSDTSSAITSISVFVP
ncbi:MAG: CAP domain-containing protein [Nitrososphaerota archaeon]|nr:CAP domain-containing protein [Nitrososphaerota archaeon]